jgi:hypothetical protein
MLGVSSFWEYLCAIPFHVKRDLKASVLDVCCTYFLYLYIGLHAGSY